MLKGDETVVSSTRYRKVCETFSKHQSFLAIESDRERERYFDDYIQMVKEQEREVAREMRGENMEKFAVLLKNIPQINCFTPWRRAIEMFSSHETFLNDPYLKSMDMIDCLTLYENHIKALEKVYFENKYHQRILQRRSERKNRNAFKVKSSPLILLLLTSFL